MAKGFVQQPITRPAVGVPSVMGGTKEWWDQQEGVGINPPRMPRIGPPKRPKHRRPFDPGFKQAPPPTQENIPPPQTFYPPATTYPAPTTYTTPTTPSSFVSPPSLAPVGAGLPRYSTSYDVGSFGSSGSGESDIPWGTIAGGAGLAAALAAYGDDDGSGLSFGNLLSGAKRLFELGDMSGMDIIKKLPEELQSIVKNLMDAPGNLMDSISEAFSSDPLSNIGQTMPSEAQFAGQTNLPYSSNLHQIEALPHDPFSAGKELANLPGPISPGAAAYASTFSSMFPGAASSTAALASTAGLTGTIGTTAVSIPSMGGALAGATTTGAGAGAGGFAAMGAMGPLAVAGAAFALMKLKRAKDPFDPTAETRRLNQYENIMQEGGAGIAGLEQLVYTTPDALQLIKDATSGSGRAAPFGTPHTSGGTKKISWSKNVSALVQENMNLLEAASAAGQAADPSGEEGLYKPEQYVPAGKVKPQPVWDYSSDPDGPPRTYTARSSEDYGGGGGADVGGGGGADV